MSLDYTVLIAEDEELNYLYLETLLRNENAANFSVLHAKNGKEAIALCEKNEGINLVLMDIKMPIMNGYDATKKIKEFRPKLPVVVLTAYSTSGDRNKAFSYGCDDFLSKPIEKEVFMNMLNRNLKLNIRPC